MVQTEINEQYLRIKALEHLIDLDFNSQRSCHEVCHLISHLFAKSDDEVSRLMANVAQKALQSSVDVHRYN